MSLSPFCGKPPLTIRRGFSRPKAKKGGEEGFFHPNFFSGKTVFLAGVHGDESEKYIHAKWLNIEQKAPDEP